MIHTSYNPLLVVASIVVAFFACHAAVELAISAVERRRKFDFFASVVTWGVAVWSTHFVGMLAFDIAEINESYGLALSVLSLPIAVLGASIASYFKLRPTKRKRWGAAFALGLSISGLHMMGMQALVRHIPAQASFGPWPWAISLIGVLLCHHGLILFGRARDQKTGRFALTARSAACFACAILFVHYATMAVTHWTLANREVSSVPIITTQGPGLSTMVMLITFMVFGAILTHSHRIHDEGRSKLEDAYKTALRASGAKDEFMAVMSHELRTPLTAVMGYAELMLDGCAGDCNEKQKAWLVAIGHSSKHLLSLIEQVLDITRAEKGKLECQVERTDASDLLRRTANILKPLADKKGLDLWINVPKTRMLVETDIGKLRQVIVNLVGNAIKFTEKGAVTVELTGTQTKLQLTVRDTGIGISEEDLVQIFEPFYQGGESAYNRSKEGAGLGLTICRDIVQLLGGTIEVRSTVGEGSMFVVTLPRVLEIALVA